MKLKSFGCSFIFGTDLPDDGRLGHIATPSHLTYPALIAARQGWDYSCHARPGAGNFEILNRILTEVSRSDPMLAVINWTWIDRFSWIDESLPNRQHPYNSMRWASILPVDTDLRAEFYYRHLHTQLRDKIETLTCIKTAIDCLRSNCISFVMTWTDVLMWETEWHCPESVAWLQDQIRPYLTDFEGTSFVQWSRDQGFDISSTMHPLQAAHEAAADLMLANWSDYMRS